MYCTADYCQRRPFSIVFATLIKQSAHKARFATAYIRRENTHNSEIEMEHLFHILCFKDSNLSQRVGIFRVQPGILEVGLVKNTREFGELQQIRECCHYIRVPEDACVTKPRVFFNELAAMVFQAPANLPVLYPVRSLEKVLYVRSVCPETVGESLRLGVPNSVAPKFYCQFLDNAFFHENLSGDIIGCHPVNL
jgi:hypothetical protein